jgi:hypothetical protein
MITLETIALAGGLFVPLVFWHFVADWLTQTEKMAEAKSHKFGILALHCLIYSVMFIPAFYLYGLESWEMVLGFLLLYVSHFIGDTYLVVFLWAKYLRRMTSMRIPEDDGSFTGTDVQVPTDIFPNYEFITTPLLFRPSLVLVIDQLWHLAFLWPIVVLALY